MSYASRRFRASMADGGLKAGEIRAEQASRLALELPGSAV